MKGFRKMLAALSAALMIALLATGCVGGRRSVWARCPLDGDSMTLPVAFERAIAGGDFTFFGSPKSLAELKEEIDENADGDVGTTLYPRTIFLEKRDEAGGLHYYCVHDLEEDGSYTFTAPAGSVGGEMWLIPFFLLDYDNSYYSFGGETCKSSAPAAAFRAFYAKTGQYELKEEENVLSVSRLGKTLELTFSEGAVSFSAK